MHEIAKYSKNESALHGAYSLYKVYFPSTKSILCPEHHEQIYGPQGVQMGARGSAYSSTRAPTFRRPTVTATASSRSTYPYSCRWDRSSQSFPTLSR